MKRNKLLLFSLILPCLATPAHAADINAASTSRADVVAAINSASSGDRVLVPSGTATWSALISLPATKDLDIIGLGIGNTVITCGTGVCFHIHLAAAHRISGFTLLNANAGGIGVVRNGNQDPNKWFRIDHNRIVSPGVWTSIDIWGGTNTVHPQGLVDNNEFVDISVKSFGTNFQLSEGDFQHVLWSRQTPLGDNSEVVYIEDNAFEGTTSNINWADSNYAGRFVFRFNTGTGQGYLEVHSVQGLNRACQRYEIYKNTFSPTVDRWPGLAFIRGGSGVLWGNRLSAIATRGLVMDNVRSLRDPGDGVGQCNGLSAWDENTPGQSGWACRDQIGRAYDTVQWSHSPPAAYNQVSQPVYFWDNIIGVSTQFPIDNKGLDIWLLENRDWYTTDTTFDGTTGVGEGPIANRAATCTTGVAYWATDEGEWNSRQAGPDGRLYKCTATNTWTLYYTPFTYPHPLQSGAMVRPLPPTNLGVVVR